MVDPISLDASDFASAKADLDQFEEKREEQIRLCRDTIRISKKIIYAIHRNNLDLALQECHEIKKVLDAIGRETFDNNLVCVAWQEAVEALTYYHIIVDGRLLTRKDLGAQTKEYLLGICDLCGELVRRAINCAAKGETQETQRIKTLVEEIFGQFLQFDFRGGELRKKSDSIKYHLNKLEDVLYDLKIHGRS